MSLTETTTKRTPSSHTPGETFDVGEQVWFYGRPPGRVRVVEIDFPGEDYSPITFVDDRGEKGRASAYQVYTNPRSLVEALRSDARALERWAEDVAGAE